MSAITPPDEVRPSPRALVRAWRLVRVHLLVLGLLLVGLAPAWAAGNVEATSRGGLLSIRGDALGNAIEIQRAGVTSFRVTGLDGTFVNGAPSQVLQVRRGFVIRMLDGDDVVRFVASQEGDALPPLRIVTGAGHDLVEFEEVVVEGSVRLSLGADSDRVQFTDTIVRRKVIVRSGPGSDIVTSVRSAFRSKVTVVTGSGVDLVSMHRTACDGKLTVKTGAGEDVLAATGCALKKLKANGGGDADRVVDGGENVFVKKSKVKKFESGGL